MVIAVFLSRGVGCIFSEMASGHPLFPGSTVDEQLHLIVKMLGTPNENTWTGATWLDEFSTYSFHFHRPEPWVKHVPRYVLMQMGIFTPFYETLTKVLMTRQVNGNDKGCWLFPLESPSTFS